MVGAHGGEGVADRIAFGFGERFLAFHHPGAGLLAEPLDVLGREVGHLYTSEPSPVAATVQIYLVGPIGHLVKVAREVPASQASLDTALDALVKGPTNEEAAAGLQSDVPARTVVLGASIGVGGVATVNLGGTFGQLVGQAQILAVAQIVFTATGVAGVTGVTFELLGQPVNVPVANGAQVTTATPAQFATLAPLPPL